MKIAPDKTFMPDYFRLFFSQTLNRLNTFEMKFHRRTVKACFIINININIWRPQTKLIFVRPKRRIADDWHEVEPIRIDQM